MENKKFDLIVFDLDGTLFDTGDSILRAIQHMLITENVADLPYETLKTFLGPPLELTMEQNFPQIPPNERTRLINAYRDYYFEHEMLTADLYPGMREVLETLKKEGYKIALATYKQLRCVEPLFKYKDVLKYFDSVRGSVEGKDWTKVDIINLAISDVGVKHVNRVCMIGDTEHDFRGAIQVGCYFIGMTYGIGYTGMSEKELKYKDFLGYCNEAKEILAKIK